MDTTRIANIFDATAGITVVYLGTILPTYAAGDAPMFSLNNTDFVVSIAFIAFVLLLIYLKVPSIIGNFLTKRSDSIKEEIDNANMILEESKSLLAKLEREHKNNIDRADQIIANAEREAKDMLVESKKELRLAIERKVSLAEDQIKAAELAVIKNIKDNAVDKAFAMAEKKIIESTSSKISSKLIEKSITEIKGQI